MIVAAFIVLAFALLVVVVALLALVSRHAPAPTRAGHRVTVHTLRPDDQTIHGVIVAEYTDRLILEGAEYITPTGGTPIPGATVAVQKPVSWIEDYGDVAVGRD